jgi:carbon monoxide dehydrogenase subunit G
MTAARIPSPFSLLAMLGVAALFALPPGHAHAETIKGSGVAKTEARSVSGFHNVALRVPATLKLRQGDSEGLSITSDDNIVPLVETVVENGTLVIRWADKHRYSTTYKAMDIVVNVKQVDGLAINGSGEIRADRLKAGNLRATIDGSGAMAFDALDANSVTAAIRGNGHLTAAGRADSLDVTLAGSGQLSAAKLDSRRATIAIQGSGEATVWAKEDLTASIAGSGEINYYGTPHLSHTVAGSGSIRRAGDSS